LILTLIDSACRIGELVHLKPEDVLENQILVTGKTGQRKYRLDSKICNIIRNMPTKNGYIFQIAEDNNPKFPSHALTERVHRIIKHAGISGNKLGAHTIRHTSASLVAKETGSILAVQSLLQHANQATSQIYIHDVQNTLQQKTSPLKLVADNIYGNNPEHIKQSALLTSGSSTEIIPIESNNNVDSIIESSFRTISEDRTIRPLLDKKDCELIRRAFICLSQFGQITTDAGESRNLWRRITRKVKTSDTQEEPSNFIP
jgi:hypothetical protein